MTPAEAYRADLLYCTDTEYIIGCLFCGLNGFSSVGGMSDCDEERPEKNTLSHKTHPEVGEEKIG